MGGPGRAQPEAAGPARSPPGGSGGSGAPGAELNRLPGGKAVSPSQQISSLRGQSVSPLSSPTQPAAGARLGQLGIAGGEMASPALSVQTHHAQALKFSRAGYYIPKN